MTAMGLVEKWRERSISLDASQAERATIITLHKAANELEAWVMDWKKDLDAADKNPKGVSLGPLYETGVNLARDFIREDILGVK